MSLGKVYMRPWIPWEGALTPKPTVLSTELSTNTGYVNISDSLSKVFYMKYHLSSMKYSSWKLEVYVFWDQLESFIKGI
jgi:hypothetical protein